MKKNPNCKIIVISSKGGVGKSTVAMQLIAPYLYERSGNNPVSFYEFDDENSDSLSYGASTLTKRDVVEVDSGILKEELAQIFSKDENACLDIGGNKTTTMVLKALEESGMLHFVDLAVIPLLDGEQDAINATIVYTTLKDIRPDLKFIFVLNRAKNSRYIKYQFDNFFGDVRGILSDTQAMKNYLFPGDSENYITLLDDDIIKFSRRFGLTIYEIAQMKKDFVELLKLNRKKFSSEEELKVVSFKNYVQKASKSYFEDVLEPSFVKLNQIMENENDHKKS